MANHVSTYVEFHQLNDAGKQVLKTMLDSLSDDKNFFEIFVNDEEFNVTADDVDYEFQIKNVGPKWCYFEDWDEVSFRTVSAWGWPENGINYIFGKIAKVDPEFFASVSYEDEMPNFHGVLVFDAGGLDDGFEEDWDDIIERMIKEFPELENEYDKEENEFTELGSEIFYDNIWETITEARQQFIDQAVDYFKNGDIE